jgi:hypothetical protein
MLPTLKCLLVGTTLLCCLISTAQDSSSINELASLSPAYYSQVTKKLEGINTKIDQSTEKYLKRISRQEKRLYKKIWKRDSLQAKQIFGNSAINYTQLKVQAASMTPKLDKFSKVYSSKLDSLQTTYKFLVTAIPVNPQLIGSLDKGTVSINNVQHTLDKTNQIQKFLKQRREFLNRQLAEIGMFKEMKKLNKEIFYYQQQIREYKQILNDPSRLEDKLLAVAMKIPAFGKFFNENSALAGLFRLPGSSIDNTTTSLAGLQTRASITQDLQSRFGSDPAAQQLIRQNISQAQDQFSQLRNQGKLSFPAKQGDPSDMPDFKPNQQKTKSLWQRLELGTNFQSQRGQGLLPVTSDIGLSVGYKLNDRSIIGVGASYKIGWGQNIRNLNISHQGAGLRSFIDWKLKRTYYISGGYEMNYRSEFNRLQELKQFNAWQSSGLLGLTKSISIRSKLFSKTRIQVFYDILHKQNTPVTQPLIFRIGYNF